MRAIFNIHSNVAARAAGWRAIEVYVKDKREVTLDEVLNATILADGRSMCDYLIGKGGIKNDWSLYVNGISLSGPSCLTTVLKDNTQIHLMDSQHVKRYK